MLYVNTRQWERLETWTDTVFLVAGVSFLGATVFLIINRFLGGIGTAGQVIEAVFYITALMGLAVGLLGFYPRVNDQSPRLALVGLAFAAITVLGYVGMVVWAVLGVVLEVVSLPGDGLAVVLFVLLLVGSLVFGGISARSGVPSRSVGILLLGIAATFGGYMGVFAVVGINPPDWLPATVGGIFTVLTLAIGYGLRTASRPTGRTEPTPTGGSS
ncbi:hypothetical protein [Halorarius halobius]|uniref:hypothetical protein n=1 Tax=Halorarius halobius TaxID=2962671 RepID=UPI0020CB758D|nr:hypothetical protein [Halorarius halobius]